jgi:hypothetical protein
MAGLVFAGMGWVGFDFGFVGGQSAGFANPRSPGWAPAFPVVLVMLRLPSSAERGWK